MDVLYFLQKHIKFIRSFHAAAVTPFEELQSKISDGLEPFIPPYSEDGEPPFLEEWSDAGASIQVVGQTCISLLSNTLKLYLNTWAAQLRFLSKEKGPKGESFLARFQRLLQGHGIVADWSECPADLGIIEQLVLARNRMQHPEMIGTLAVQHDHATLQKYPSPLFVSAAELEWLVPADASWDGGFLMNPTLFVDGDSLEQAIVAVETLAVWLEPQLHDFKYGKRAPAELG